MPQTLRHVHLRDVGVRGTLQRGQGLDPPAQANPCRETRAPATRTLSHSRIHRLYRPKTGLLRRCAGWPYPLLQQLQGCFSILVSRRIFTQKLGRGRPVHQSQKLQLSGRQSVCTTLHGRRFKPLGIVHVCPFVDKPTRTVVLIASLSHNEVLKTERSNALLR